MDGGSDQNYPKEKEIKKTKWLSEQYLQIAEKRREAKGKTERELNPEFYRIARRDKKAFLSEQHKEIDENNRIGTARDFFKKIGGTGETFHTKNGHNKGQKWQGP